MITQTNFISELQSRNPEALNYIVDKYGNLIYKIAYSNLKSTQLAEECVNDVLLKVWNLIDSYNYSKGKFSTWITTITKNTSIDMLRKEKKFWGSIEYDQSMSSSYENIEDDHITKTELLKVKDNIMSFNEIDRDIFIQHFFLCKSLKDIAAKLDMSVNSISLRILRARKKLGSFTDQDHS